MRTEYIYTCSLDKDLVLYEYTVIGDVLLECLVEDIATDFYEEIYEEGVDGAWDEVEFEVYDKQSKSLICKATVDLKRIPTFFVKDLKTP